MFSLQVLKSDTRRVEKRLYLKRYDFVLGEVECEQVNLRARYRILADLSLLFLRHINLKRPTHLVVVGLQQGRDDALKIVHQWLQSVVANSLPE